MRAGMKPPPLLTYGPKFERIQILVREYGTWVRSMRAGMKPPPPMAMITSGSKARTLREGIRVQAH